MLLGCSGVGDKLHGFSETIKNKSAGSRIYRKQREKIAKKHKYQLL